MQRFVWSGIQHSSVAQRNASLCSKHSETRHAGFTEEDEMLSALLPPLTVQTHRWVHAIMSPFPPRGCAVLYVIPVSRITKLEKVRNRIR